MPTRARPPSVSRKQTIRFGKRSSRRVCNNGNSSGGVNVVKDALPTACDSQGHAKWRTRPYGPLPRLHQTTSFSLRNWRSSRRRRFIARLFADKSESPPVIHSNDRHDVTLETNHLGFVTTKRSVVRWKNKQKYVKGRIWIVPPSRCLWGPSVRGFNDLCSLTTTTESYDSYRMLQSTTVSIQAWLPRHQETNRKPHLNVCWDSTHDPNSLNPYKHTIAILNLFELKRLAWEPHLEK